MAFLALNPRTDISRERLLELFWPDAEPERARNSLKTALSNIRRCVKATGYDPDECVVANKSVVRWTADTVVDALAFAQHATQQALDENREATRLYRGDFLEGDYDQWATAERERLAALYETALARVVRTTKDTEAAHRFIARNPYNEEAYAVLVQADIEVGRRAEAATWVRRCREALAEVGEKPSAAFDSRFGDVVRPEPGVKLAASALGDRTNVRETRSRQSITSRLPVDVRPNNLPHQATSFVGRTQAIADVKALLAKSEAVTLVGTGGVGKTRVALRVGDDLLNGFRDGVWFADLAPVTEGYVASQIASIFSLRAVGDRSLFDQVLLHLKEKKLLLILDNCEHVIGEAARIVVALVKECASIKVLATSRELLNVRGEQVYPLPSLSVPPQQHVSTASDALDHEAVALFIDRASAADARFKLTDENAGPIADICRRLDGIALAIELAAARVRILNVAQIAQRLDERFGLLTGGDRTALPRQQTMRAALDWSYGLLSEEAKTLFRRLSIFQGGWSLEAAVAVCADDLLDEAAVLDKLSTLVDKSLVVVDLEVASQRYRLLETLRQYGIERLKQRGELDSVAERHAAYFSEFGRKAKETGRTTPRPAWLAHVNAEIDNIRATLEWSFGQGKDAVLGAELVECLWVFWLNSPYHAEGVRWIETACSAPDLKTNPRLNTALALAMSGLLMGLAVPPQALQWARRSLESARALGDERMLCRACYYLGQILVFKNELDEAEPVLNEALELTQRLDDRLRASIILQMLGRLHRMRGNADLAGEVLMRATRLYPDLPSNPMALLEQACLMKLHGDVAGAAELALEAVRKSESMGEGRNEGIARTCLVFYLAFARDIEKASWHARQVVHWVVEMRYEYWFPFIAEATAAVALQRGDVERAAYLLGWAEQSEQAKSLRRDSTRGSGMLHTFAEVDLEWFMAPLRAHFGDERFAALIAEGAAWSSDRAIEEMRAVLA